MISEADILNATILIVDDQSAHLPALKTLLREAGYTALSFTTNPVELCALNRANHYDLILLDLALPGMVGVQVLEDLKLDEKDGYLSVIVLNADAGQKLRALQAGAKDFIRRPFDAIEVKARVRNMLEIRLCHKKIEQHNAQLETAVRERTAQLVESENRFRSLTALASDWYWEQNETGDFTTVSGPVFEMLGIRMTAFLGRNTDGEKGGWDEAERNALQAMIAARKPFLDFAFSRAGNNGARHNYRVSGEPTFDPTCGFTGYRGIGVEVLSTN
jgi:CheY-like chemotaxis protein